MRLTVSGTKQKHIDMPAIYFQSTDAPWTAARRGLGWDLVEDRMQGLFAGPFNIGSGMDNAPETINVKAHVLWTTTYHNYFTDYSAGAPNVGFYAVLERFRKEQAGEPSAKAVIDGMPLGDCASVRMQTVIAQGHELGTLGPVATSYRSDGRINWKFKEESAFPAYTVEMPNSHPYAQIALGTQAMELTTIDPSKIGGAGASYPSILNRIYRTPINLLCKRSSGFYLDSDMTFEDMPFAVDDDSPGMWITIGRTMPFIGNPQAGDLPLGTLALDDLAEEVLFLGLELEIV